MCHFRIHNCTEAEHLRWDNTNIINAAQNTQLRLVLSRTTGITCGCDDTGWLLLEWFTFGNKASILFEILNQRFIHGTCGWANWQMWNPPSLLSVMTWVSVRLLTLELKCRLAKMAAGYDGNLRPLAVATYDVREGLGVQLKLTWLQPACSLFVLYR